MNDTKAAPLTDEQQAFLSKLRSSTDVMHKKLEDSGLSRALMSKDLSLTDYANYLLHMRNVIAFCEEQVYPMLSAVIPDLEQRRKLPHIEHDIAAISKQVTLPEPAAYKATIDKQDIPFALGFMYVIEGSTLGGRILLKHIEDTLNIDAQNVATFFTGYGALTGSMWKSFIDKFSAYAASCGKEDEVIAGSNYAFNTIEEYFS